MKWPPTTQQFSSSARLLPAGARPLAPVPPPLSRTLRRAQRGRPPGLLRRSGAARRQARFRRRARAFAPLRVGRLRQATLRRAESRARLSLSLHPPRRDLQFPAHWARPGGRDFQMEGLPNQGLPNQRPRPAQDHDARRRRGHSPLSPPPPAGPTGSPPTRPYGLFAGTVRARNIERVRQLLAAPEASPERSRNAADSEAERPSPLRQCPGCGGRMIIVETFEGARSSRSPSPSRIRIDTP